MAVLQYCCRQISTALKCKTNTSFVNSFILKTDPWETYIIGLKKRQTFCFSMTWLIFGICQLWKFLMKLSFPIGKLFPINFPAAHQFWTIMIGINIQLELYDICSTKPQWHILLWIGLKICRKGKGLCFKSASFQNAQPQIRPLAPLKTPHLNFRPLRIFFELNWKKKSKKNFSSDFLWFFFPFRPIIFLGNLVANFNCRPLR